MLFALSALVLTSCSDDESAGKSRITYYPTIELEGGTVIVAQGSNYVEPGYVSLMNGEDVSDEVVVTSNVDTSKHGVYTVTYTTKKNEDGFVASASRKVIVLDTTSDIEGIYQLDGANSYRNYNGQVAIGRNYEILIFDNYDGTYEVEDMIGGWYYLRAGYGINYAMNGIISIDADGTVNLLESLVPGWADSAEDFTGSYDAATSTFTWDVTYTDYPFVFHVILTKE